MRFLFLVIYLTPGTSDPFVKFSHNDISYKTKYVKKTLNPVWNESFVLSAFIIVIFYSLIFAETLPIVVIKSPSRSMIKILVHQGLIEMKECLKAS